MKHFLIIDDSSIADDETIISSNIGWKMMKYFEKNLLILANINDSNDNVSKILASISRCVL